MKHLLRVRRAHTGQLTQFSEPSCKFGLACLVFIILTDEGAWAQRVPKFALGYLVTERPSQGLQGALPGSIGHAGRGEGGGSSTRVTKKSWSGVAKQKWKHQCPGGHGSPAEVSVEGEGSWEFSH